jgi:DNA-binding Lrp family transcriptional regulator
MKLSSTQKQVLQAALLNANKSVSELSRLLKMNRHTVHKAISTFFEKKIFIRRSIYVDHHMLGLTMHVVLVSLSPEGLKARDKFINLLCSCDEVGTTVELGTGEEFEIRIFTRNRDDLAMFFDSLAARFPHPFYIRSCLMAFESEYFGGLAGLPSIKSDRPLCFEPLRATEPPCELDDKDHIILSTLANFQYLNLQEVARALGMPSSSLQYRIEKLETSNVIKGHFYILDPKVFGELPFGFRIKARALTPVARQTLRTFCREHPLITWITFFVGDQSAEIYTLAPNFGLTQSVLTDLMDRFGDSLESTQIRPQLNFHKFSTYPYKRHPTKKAATLQQGPDARKIKV